MYLLDTSVIWELRKAGDGKANADLVTWLSARASYSLYISAVSIAELESDVLRLTRRDAAQGRMLRAWMDERVLPEFHQRILPIDAAVALRCAALNVDAVCSQRNGPIAATALVHRMTLVTCNTADFASCGIRVLDPWLPQPSGHQ
jgi:toxin FitB